MKIFLTGGTGFIGSYVLAAALQAGHDVIALRRSEESEPVIDIPMQPEWCIGNLETIGARDLSDVDVVIHLAATGISPRHASLAKLLEINIRGSITLMEYAAAAGVRRFVAVGTCQEYGSSASHFESIPPTAPLEPLNTYGASKATAFRLMKAFAIEQEMEMFYGRIFTTFGIGQFEGSFWPSLRRAALDGLDFPMTDGLQISDFTEVSQVALHLLVACQRSDITSRFPLVTNIGTGNATSLLEFAREQWRLHSARGILLPGALPRRKDQMDRCVPDLINLIPSPIPFAIPS